MQIEDPFILVTPGGGGDGETMVDWVLRAYEADSNMPNRALIVLGPFMQSKRQSDFMARAEALPNVDAITFDSHLERLIERAVGIVAMGGYNTFCEILSFDKRALIVPRTIPRREQYLRASRAQEIGLVRMLGDDGECTTEDMITALLDLPQQQKPSDSIVPGILDGLKNVNRLVHQLLRKRRQATPRLAESRG
jgi:predicted glycosyltransferase